MQKTIVFVKTTFQAFHRWTNAPGVVAFLRSYHRHLFYVKVSVLVSHDDREIEFFQFKEELDRYITVMWLDKYFESSCEMIAKDIMDKFNAEVVSVSEDDENGAIVLK